MVGSNEHAITNSYDVSTCTPHGDYMAVRRCWYIYIYVSLLHQGALNHRQRCCLRGNVFWSSVGSLIMLKHHDVHSWPED